jgi:hypothetical protein
MHAHDRPELPPSNLPPFRTLPLRYNPNTTTAFGLKLRVTMSPNPKAKKDVQKSTVKGDKPVSMIEKDGPIVDSPLATDLGEWYPEDSPQDVRVFTFTPLNQRCHRVNVFLFLGSSRTSPVRHPWSTKSHARAPIANIAGVGWVITRRVSCQTTTTLSRVSNPDRSHCAV